MPGQAVGRGHRAQGLGRPAAACGPVWFGTRRRRKGIFSMDMQATAGEGFTTVAISGRLDAATAPAAEAALTRTIDAGAARLVLNLARLDYISSAGLRVLLASAKKVSRQNGKVVLCELQPAVREVFEISGLLTVFPLAATAADAQTIAKG